MASVSVTINADNSISVNPDPVAVKPGDTITWNVADNSTKGITVNFDTWQLISGTSSFASPFSKSGNPDFVTKKIGPGEKASVSSDPVQAEVNTTWSYTVALVGLGISIDPRVVISGSFPGEKAEGREVY
jgi:plastocyanin